MDNDKRCDFALFERDVGAELLGWVRVSQENGEELWSALANIIWKHKSGVVATYSFRSAGSFVASLRNADENYMTFYCASPDGRVSDKIKEAMEARGWTPHEYPPH